MGRGSKITRWSHFVYQGKKVSLSTRGGVGLGGMKRKFIPASTYALPSDVRREMLFLNRIESLVEGGNARREDKGNLQMVVLICFNNLVKTQRRR